MISHYVVILQVVWQEFLSAHHQGWKGCGELWALLGGWGGCPALLQRGVEGDDHQTIRPPWHRTSQCCIRCDCTETRYVLLGHSVKVFLASLMLVYVLFVLHLTKIWCVFLAILLLFTCKHCTPIECMYVCGGTFCFHYVSPSLKGKCIQWCFHAGENPLSTFSIIIKL